MLVKTKSKNFFHEPMYHLPDDIIALKMEEKDKTKIKDFIYNEDFYCGFIARVLYTLLQ